VPAATATEPIERDPVPVEAAAEPALVANAEPAADPEDGDDPHAVLLPSANPATMHGVVSELI